MYKISLNQENIFTNKIGLNGIDNEVFYAWEQKFKEVLKEIQNDINTDKIGWPSLPFQEEEISKIAKFAKDERKKWDNILVLGIGGSSLGSIAIKQALQKDVSKKLIILDNIDPDFFTEKLENINWKKTLVVAISKSGKTPETMAQFFIIENILKHECPDNYNQHILVITDPEKSILLDIAETEQYPTFEIPENVGGRFSVLSAVGLLPAALIGVDIQKLCHGAREMNFDCFKENLAQNPAAQLALSSYLLDRKKGKKIQVMLPYSNALIGFADWYKQLLAESIGKNEETGLTPTASLGATDQHSQLQLWNEGPQDKLITFLEVQNFQHNIPIPKILYPEFSYLKEKSLNQLIHAEKYATQMALTNNHRPNQTILIPKVSEETIGQLFYLFEMQIAILGKLYNIDAYNQPGVEEGKVLTKRIMENS